VTKSASMPYAAYNIPLRYLHPLEHSLA
jgi:hypothetical protein